MTVYVLGDNGAHRPLVNSDISSLTTTRIDVRSYGAVGDGVANDSVAINAAIDASIALFVSGKPNVVYLSAGRYKYVTPHATMTYPISFIGDGHLKTVIQVDTALSGNLFAWSDVWQGNAQGSGTTYALLAGSPPDRAGVTVSGLSVIGNTTTANIQNVFVFYDRADFVLFDDVHIWYMKGRGLYNGVLLNTTASYMRESHFNNVRFNSCGTTAIPVVELSSEGAGGDATNEVQFYNLNINGANGPSLVIRNNSTSAVRYLNFYGLRIEGNAADNLITIGDATFAGTINSINVYGLQLLGAPAGKSAIATLAPNQTAGNNIFNINFDGFISNCTGKGINVQAGRALWFKIWQMNTTDTNVTIGAASLGIGKVVIDSGTEQHNGWTQAIDISMNFNVIMPKPLAGKPSIISGYSFSGNGTPEAVITAPIGSIYHRSDGGAATSFYVKESGVGNTGWIAK